MTERRSQVEVVDTRRSRRFALDQKIRYRYSAPVTNVRQRLKVVPPSAHGPQLRRRWQLTVDGVKSPRTRSSLDRFGNVTVDVTVPHVDEFVEFAIEVEADTDPSGWPTGAAFDAAYLRPTRLTASDDVIAGLAAPDGGATDVAALCARVHRSLDYEWGITGVSTTASEALAGGRGVCQDYAHIMLAACRMVGVAARYVSGHLAGEGGSHAWVEVLQPDPGSGRWIAQGWDPTHDRPVNSDYLVVAIGRDYSDVAPLSGTYQGEEATNSLSVAKRLELT